jgi:lipoprotein-anchoring transpeptidase ErfK/SrfK
MPSFTRTVIIAVTLLAMTCGPAAAKSEVVQIDLGYPAGSIVIVNGERKLYYITGNGRAIRYGVAVGKPEELWMGRTFVVDKKVDPRWVPIDGNDPVDGGDDENPLGRRALYLDWSLLRIHGTPSRGSIGRAVSNGCVRMLNEDVVDLFERVHLGAPVFAISSRDQAGWYVDAKVANRDFANPTARANKEAADKAAEKAARQ